MPSDFQVQSISHFLVFFLDGVKYGVRIAHVRTVVRAVEITAIPEPHAVVMGVVNLHGTIVPIVNIRRRFGLPERPVRASDTMIFCNSEDRVFGVVVDAVAGHFASREVTTGTEIWPGMEFIDGVVKDAEGMILINSVERLFREEDAGEFAQAMAGPEVMEG